MDNVIQPEAIKEKPRNSVFELTRILAILFIIASHYVVHGLDVSKIESAFVENGGGLYFLNVFLASAFQLGNIGVAIFMIISGMFMINGKAKISKALVLTAEAIFYSGLIYIICCCTGIVTFSVKEAIKAFLPFFYEQSWFVGAYLLIYIFSPFINRFLHVLSYKQLCLFVLLCVLCWSIIPTFILANFYLSNLTRVFFLYCLGGFIKLSIDRKTLFGQKKFGVILVVTSSVLLPASVICIELTSFVIPSLISYTSHFYSVYSVLGNILAYGIVLLGNYLKPFHSKTINIIASTSLGVYLIHDNANFKYYLWDNIFKASEFEFSPYLIVAIIVCTFIVFIFCVLIDLIRHYCLEKLLTKLAAKPLSRLDSWYLSFFGAI